MDISPEQLERRKVIWDAFSVLFLDNVVEEHDHRYIAKCILECGYTVSEAERILYEEVYPLLIPNLLTIVGECFGWDREWLASAIIASLQNRDHHPHLALHRHMIQDDWQAVKRYLERSKTLN